MRYQNPQLLYALFVIAIPIILHLLNLKKHKTIYFSSIRFLKNIKEESHKRSKLKNLLILISRILAIIFLILAFSKPYIPSNTKINNNVFIYIDNSFSMDAKNKQGILLNIAKEKARIIIDSYKHETTFYLITNDFLKIHNNSYTNNEISEQIDNITSSSSFKSINQVINKQPTIQKEFSDLYIISDMQASTIDIENISQINKNLNLFFIPIYPQTYNNITIDKISISLGLVLVLIIFVELNYNI